MPIMAKFQFYDSPIKRNIHSKFVSKVDRGFNSMIVRLKEIRLPASYTPAYTFQFYDSPIKSVDTEGIVFSSITFQFYDSPIKSAFLVCFIFFTPCSFNSMIVRLKAAGCAHQSPHAGQGFNSMIVRLKARYFRRR